MTLLRCLLVVISLLSLAGSKAVAQSDLLATLRPEHPRVMATGDELRNLRTNRTTDAELDEVLTLVQKQADKALDKPLLKRELTGIRLLSVSREALLRITNLAMAYHATGDERYARRAEEEMLNVCTFSDWNPKHFLDVAEMATAVGLGYDWLYDELSPESRQKIREGLRTHALELIADNHWWKYCDHNWNSVCFGGLTMAALAVAEDEPELARRILAETKKHNPKASRCYEPDGVYPEGPGYWVYGTSFQVMLVDSLETALGTDLGLAPAGMMASGTFVAQATSPTGRAYNYADGHEKVGAPAPLDWFAAKTNTPDCMAAVKQLTGDTNRGRMVALVPLWRDPSPSEAQPLALSWCGQGQQPLAMFRTSWNDRNAMYLATKGGRATINHGHMDAGSFIFEADSIRWSIDLGSVNYNQYEQRGIRLFKEDRWKIFPYVNYAHSTLTIDNQLYKEKGQSTLTDFQPLEEGRGSVTVDMKPVLTDVDQATRQFTFDATGRQVTVADHVTGLHPQADIRWVMVTDATADIDGPRVTLTQSGKTLTVTAASETPGEWQWLPCTPPEGMYGDPEPHTHLLTWQAQAPESGEFDLSVTLSPGK